jgi:pimeloyl-ACP methyl ester carboxylesterase
VLRPPPPKRIPPEVTDLRETLITGRERDYVAWFLKVKTLSPNTFDSADIDHYAASIAAEGGLRAALGHFRDAAESGRENRAALERGQLTIPVLGVSSSHGSIPDMAASLSPWARTVTGVVIPGAGHFIPDEQPDATVDALTAFIDGRMSGSASQAAGQAPALRSFNAKRWQRVACLIRRGIEGWRAAVWSGTLGRRGTVGSMR